MFSRRLARAMKAALRAAGSGRPHRVASLRAIPFPDGGITINEPSSRSAGSMSVRSARIRRSRNRATGHAAC